MSDATIRVERLAPGRRDDFLAFFDHERGPAFADNPEDDSVLGSLCDLLARQGKFKQLIKILGETLPSLPTVGDAPAARQLRASLWERFGEVTRKKDPARAISAFEQAVERGLVGQRTGP